MSSEPMTELGIRDGLRFRGEVRVHTFNGDVDPALLDDPQHPDWARLVESVTQRNTVMNNGRAAMTNLIMAASTVGANYIGLSTTAVTVALTDTALPNELIRKQGTIKQIVSSYTQRYVAYYATTDFNSTGIGGCGLFDTASTGGTMWAEAAITLSKPNTTSATVDWRITASS